MNTDHIQYRGLDKAASRPMTDEEMKVLISLSLASRQVDSLPEVESTGIYQILTRRITTHGILLSDVADPWTFYLMAALSPNPAVAVMWAYTLMLWRMEEEEPFNLEMVCTQRIPYGVPTDDAIHRAWVDQKQDGGHSFNDNQLDGLALTKPVADAIKSSIPEINEYPKPAED